MVEYDLEIKLKVTVDGKEVNDVYVETGTGLADNIEEDLEMFVKPRIAAGGFILIRRMAKKF